MNKLIIGFIFLLMTSPVFADAPFAGMEKEQVKPISLIFDQLELLGKYQKVKNENNENKLIIAGYEQEMINLENQIFDYKDYIRDLQIENTELNKKVTNPEKIYITEEIIPWWAYAGYILAVGFLIF